MVTLPVLLRGGSAIETNAIAAGSGLLSLFTVNEPEKMRDREVTLPFLSLLTVL
jgi:hypothetical protein